jgi:hypothetical protein
MGIAGAANGWSTREGAGASAVKQSERDSTRNRDMLESGVGYVLFTAIPTFFWIRIATGHGWPNGNPAETIVYSTVICAWTIAAIVVTLLLIRASLRRRIKSNDYR